MTEEDGTRRTRQKKRRQPRGFHRGEWKWLFEGRAPTEDRYSIFTGEGKRHLPNSHVIRRNASSNKSKGFVAFVVSFRSTEFRSARFYCTSFSFVAIFFSLHLSLGKFSTVLLTICRLNWRFAYAQAAIRAAFCRDSRTCETFNVERICFSPPVKLHWFGEELSGTHRRGIEFLANLLTRTLYGQLTLQRYYRAFVAIRLFDSRGIAQLMFFPPIFSPLINKVSQLVTTAFTPAVLRQTRTPFSRQWQFRGAFVESSRKIYSGRRYDKNYGERCTQLYRKIRKRAPNGRGMNFIGPIRNEIEACRNYRDAFRGEWNRFLTVRPIFSHCCARRILGTSTELHHACTVACATASVTYFKTTKPGCISSLVT